MITLTMSILFWITCTSTTSDWVGMPEIVCSLADSRGDDTNLFKDYLTSFKKLYKEIKDLQDSKEILARQPDSMDKLKETKDKIDEGIKELTEFLSKMDRTIEMMKDSKDEEKTSMFEHLDDSKRKCQEMLDVMIKKENADFTDKNNSKRKRNKYGLSREEQLILDNWEQQMKEIVYLLG